MMVTNQRENRMDQADVAVLSSVALGKMPAKQQQPLEVLMAPELLPQAPWCGGMPIAPERALLAAETMAVRSQPTGPEFYYMQPQMQPSLYQTGAGVGMGCPYKAWEVEGILRMAMPQQYED